MSKLQFKIVKTKGKARVGEISLNGVSLSTPVFMPCATKGTLKGIPYNLLTPELLGSDYPLQIILNNTFHLYLRPGSQIIKDAGGVHTFQKWDKLILTDSGGFQVFSLGLGKDKPLFTLHQDGVSFVSPYDGSKHKFTPTGVVDIQRALGSDIMMMLDVCSPVENITKQEVKEHMQLTHKRATTAYQYHTQQYDNYTGVLFPIVQGGLYPDLRQQSAEHLSAYARDGIAIGGLSVGETKEEMYSTLAAVMPHLPLNKPRYLMGVGTPEDIRMGVNMGVDMFDCVLPTRLGRHGVAFSDQGQIKLKNAQYAHDHTPLDSTTTCFASQHTKAYLHHLIRENEMLGGILLSLHNISYLHRLTEKIKLDILSE